MMRKILIPKESDLSKLFAASDPKWVTHRYRFADSGTRRTDSGMFLLWVPLISGFDLNAEPVPVYEARARGYDTTRLWALVQGVDVIGYMLDYRDPFRAHVNGGAVVLDRKGRVAKDGEEAVLAYSGPSMSVLETPAYVSVIYKVPVNTNEWK